MKFKNNAPITYHVVIDTKYGNHTNAFTNLHLARLDVRALNKLSEEKGRYKVITYDQRGTR